MIKTAVKFTSPKSVVVKKPITDTSTTTTSKPSSGTTKPSVTVESFAAIKHMQTAIRNFAKAVTDYSYKKSPIKNQPPVVDDTRKDFNDFITEQYISGTQQPGMEYSTDPKVTSQKDKESTQTSLHEMHIVLDGLKRIGSSVKENMEDGSWDFRTNNALKNIWSFAQSLLELQKDFGRKPLTVFTNEDLQTIGNNVPMNIAKLDRGRAEKGNFIYSQNQDVNEEKKERAERLIEPIDKLTQFYKQFSTQVLERPEYRPLIEKRVPLTTIGGPAKEKQVDMAEKNPKENDFIKKIQSPNAMDKKDRSIPIKLTDSSGNQRLTNLYLLNLTSPKDFDSLMESLGYSKEHVMAKRQLLAEISKQLEDVSLAPAETQVNKPIPSKENPYQQSSESTNVFTSRKPKELLTFDKVK